MTGPQAPIPAIVGEPCRLAADGAVSIGDVQLRPATPQERDTAFDESAPPVVAGSDESLYARYDMFNTDGTVFCAHLDLFYDRGGYLSLAEQRRTPAGEFEVRVTDVPVSAFIGPAGLPGRRDELTRQMMRYGKRLHDWNPTQPAGWRNIGRRGLKERCGAAAAAC